MKNPAKSSLDLPAVTPDYPANCEIREIGQSEDEGSFQLEDLQIENISNIAHEQDSPQFTIEAFIENKPEICLIDSGSPVSLCNDITAKRLLGRQFSLTKLKRRFSE